MKKLAFAFIALFLTVGMGRAEDRTLADISNDARFSRDAVVATMASGTWNLDRAQGEPSIGKEKSMPVIFAGVGAIALGLYLATTSSQSVTITNPLDPNNPITISARSNGRLGGGIGLSALGGVLLWKGGLF